jgi:hypothetical protein
MAKEFNLDYCSVTQLMKFPVFLGINLRKIEGD